MRSGALLGRFEALEDPPKGMPRVHLTPLTQVPFSAWRMAAAGGAVWKVAGSGLPAEVLHAQPRRAVRRIALNPAGGLFYGTQDSVGYAGENASFDFMGCSRCRLAVAKDSL